MKRAYLVTGIILGAFSLLVLAPTVSTTQFFNDAVFTVYDNGDASKQLKFEVSSVTGTKTLTVPDADGTIAITSGNIATATALATPRAIGGVNFDGTAAITPTTIVVADTADTSAYVGLWDSATGNLLPKTDAGITYNAGSGSMTIESGTIYVNGGGFNSNRDLDLTGGVDSDFYIRDGATAWLNIYPEADADIVFDALVGDIKLDAGGGNVDITGDLAVSGNVDITGDLAVSGELTVNGSRVSQYKGTNQTIGSAVYTLVDWHSEEYDNLSENNLTTNVFTPGSAGYYLVCTQARLSSLTAAGDFFIVKVVKGAGGSSAPTVIRQTLYLNAAATVVMYMNVVKVVYLSSASDYLSTYVYHNEGNNQTLNGDADALWTWQTITRIQ